MYGSTGQSSRCFTPVHKDEMNTGKLFHQQQTAQDRSVSKLTAEFPIHCFTGALKYFFNLCFDSNYHRTGRKAVVNLYIIIKVIELKN